MNFVNNIIIRAENDVVPIIPHTRKYLSLIGFLPEKLTFYTVTKAIFMMNIFITVLIGIIGHLYYVFNCIDNIVFTDIADDLAGISTITMCYFVVMSNVYYSPDIHKAMEEYGDFRNLDMPEDFEKTAITLERTAHSISLIFAFSGVGTVLLLLLESLIRCKDGTLDVCGLVITAYLPYVDVSFAPVRQIWMLIQCISFFGAWSAVSSVWVLSSFAELLVVYMRHLGLMFMKTKTIETTEGRRKHFKHCVYYHHQIIKLHTIVRNIGGLTGMFYDIACSASIALTAYQLFFLAVRFQTLFHFCAVVACTGVLSFMSEHLLQENDNLANSVYNGVPWDGNTDITMDYCLVLLRVQRPMLVPCGKFGAMGTIKFADLIRRAYSFLTLMKNI